MCMCALGKAPIFSCVTVEASLQDSSSHTGVGLLCEVLSQRKHPDIERNVSFAGSRGSVYLSWIGMSIGLNLQMGTGA